MEEEEEEEEKGWLVAIGALGISLGAHRLKIIVKFLYRRERKWEEGTLMKLLDNLNVGVALIFHFFSTIFFCKVHFFSTMLLRHLSCILLN